MLFSKFLQWEDIFLGLLLVTTALTTTTSPFEFPSLGANQRLDMRAGFASSSEMTVGSASGPSSWNWQKIIEIKLKYLLFRSFFGTRSWARIKPTIYQLEHCPTLRDLLVDTGYIKKPNFVRLWLSVKWHHFLWAIMAIFDKKE